MQSRRARKWNVGAGAAIAMWIGAWASPAMAQSADPNAAPAGGNAAAAGDTSGMATSPGDTSLGNAIAASAGAAPPAATPAGGGAPANGAAPPAAKRDSGSPSGYSYGDRGSAATAILAGGSGVPRSRAASGGGGHHKAASSAAIATYPGFAMREDGGSTVFVQLTKPVDVVEHKAAGVVTYVLKGAHVVHRNNENPLVTVDFNTPVTRARLTQAHGGLSLVIDLRGDVAPVYKVEAAEGGSRLAVDFPSGNYVDANANPIPTAGDAYIEGGDGRAASGRAAAAPTASRGAVTRSTYRMAGGGGRRGGGHHTGVTAPPLPTAPTMPNAQATPSTGTMP